jgi:hypothetical protein
LAGVAAYLAFRTGRTSPDGKKKKFSLALVGGQLLMFSGIAVAVIILAEWLRPSFSPFAFWIDASLFAVWASVFPVLTDDPWTVHVKPIYVDKDGAKVPLPEVHHAPKEKSGGKDAHDHGKKAPASITASTDQLIAEREKKQYLTVQGVTRAQFLKISMGATLFGAAANPFWATRGEVLPSMGLFVGAWFFLLTILTVAQYFNGYILPVLVQNLITDLLGGSPKAIGGMFVVALLLALLFSQAGERKLVGNLHGYTDDMLEVDSGRNTYSVPAERLPRIAAVSARALCLENKTQMELDRPGYCTRHPEFKTCSCD